METTQTYAFGVDLRLVDTAEGGRSAPLAGGLEGRFQYRPNWGLPGMTPPEQSGAPVFGFSRENIAPGERARAVIVPPFPGMIPDWARVELGAELPMYEGVRVCGYGRMLWRVETTLPLPDAHVTGFTQWLQEGGEPPPPPT